MRGLYKILLLFLLACQDQNVLGSKIINGTTAGDDLMKYMVSVQEDDEHICGGFLVSKHFVVTHGGCKFDKKGKVMVVLGTYDLSKPGNKRKEHIISTCKPPPGIGTDIMLIEINSKKPEDLPEKNQLQDPDKDLKEKCQVAGWAPVDNNDIDHVDQLHVVDVTVISPKACKVQIPGLRANAICTGGEPTTDKGGFCKIFPAHREMLVEPSCARVKLLELRLSTTTVPSQVYPTSTLISQNTVPGSTAVLKRRNV
ncbi:complement factor D-like isoform X1 [Gymnodraco acuticeps]|uniref:Complement factor D-like isoform X1 n=1 Tax=Gymnodraco acuticeps TaxID=8218 RepID=A0A6P8X3U9_GYMAC|nr:complement factor D-like isoform X1 [Gymnodraco acuticeps]